MIVADICAWIEAQVGGGLGRKFMPYLQDRRNLMLRVALPVVSFFDNTNDIADFKVAKRTTN